MRKLILDVDALEVESFETAAEARETGTVNGRAAALEPDIDKSPIYSCKTCFASCKTCDVSCNGTCFDATCLSCFTCATCGESCGVTMCQATFPDNCCVIV
jgi:hypothetical protein